MLAEVVRLYAPLQSTLKKVTLKMLLYLRDGPTATYSILYSKDAAKIRMQVDDGGALTV